MLSIKNIKSSGVASKYYAESDYYTSGDKEQIVSEWEGKGAEDLGISGEVDIKQFKDIMDGILPSGEMLGKNAKGGSKEHKKGWDLTFSAPKSVSILALAGGDDRLVKAHQQASKSALGFMQDNLVVTRQSIKGDVKQIKTGNIIAASFLHTTSRSLDPQLHTHNVVMNATKRSDGQWRSIESRNIYDNSMLLGQIYRSELAGLVKTLGYEITTNPKTGTFEIKGVPNEVKKSFSKRREEIKAAVKEFGYSTAKGFDKAAVRTRASKKDVPKSEIDKSWKKELTELGYSPQEVINSAKERANEINENIRDGNDFSKNEKEETNSGGGNAKTTDPSRAIDGHDKNVFSSSKLTESALADVTFAFKNLAEREAVFEKEELVRKTMQWGVGNNSIGSIMKAIDHLVQKGPIISSEINGKQAFTTEKAFKKEKYIQRLMHAGKGQYKPIASRSIISEAVSGKGFEKGQEDAARLILSSKDRLVGVQGLAGTGKTYMLDTVREVIESRGLQVKGFAPTGTAAEQLEKDSGIKSQTLASHLYSLKNAKKTVSAKDQVWVVDEASLMNSDDAADLLTHSKASGARIVMVGDRHQIGAIDWGKPFHQLVRGGMKSAEMKEIRRQQDSPKLLSGVYYSIDNKPAKSLEAIKDTVVEVNDRDERVGLIVKHYLSLSPNERQEMLVLIPDNETRSEVNKMIRVGLQKEGVVGKDALSTTVLVSEGLTLMEKGNTRFYDAGMVVQFGRTYVSLGVNKEERLVVERVDKGIVTLKKENGELIAWNPQKIAGQAKNGVEVYREEERVIGEGDQIRWKKTDQEKELKNGYRGTIQKIEGDVATIKFNNGKQLEINVKENKLWDLGYATTIFSAQGATYKNVIINAESWRKNLMNIKTFYVGISRAKQDAFVYTDDKQKLATGLEQRSGEKTSSIEGQKLSYDKLMGSDGLIKDTRFEQIKDSIGKTASKVVGKVKSSFKIEMDM